MAYKFSPKIVTDGLVLYLDAANTKSYSGTGTRWTDLSKNNFSAIITGPTTYSTSNYGQFVYSGNSWVYITPQTVFTTLINNFTIMGWINMRSLGIGHRIFSLGYVNQWQLETRGSLGTRLSINYNNGGGLVFQQSGPIISANVWQQVGFVMNNSNVNYILNGQIITAGAFTVTGNGGNFLNGNQNYSIGNYTAALDGAFPGSIASHQVYNRVLSESEILQNYNTTKTRFGL